MEELKGDNLLRDFFDNISNNYDDIVNKEGEYAVLEKAGRLFERHNYVTGNILDLGCGTGLLSEYLNGKFSYTGIDFSRGMLENASSKGYETLEGMIEDEIRNIPDKSYDFVVSFSAFYYVKDVVKMIKEMYRVARRAVIFDLCDLPSSYISGVQENVNNHASIELPQKEFTHVVEDFKMFAWISPTLNIPIDTRMFLISMLD